MDTDWAEILHKRAKKSFLGLPPNGLKGLKTGEKEKAANCCFAALLMGVARTGIEPVFHP